MLNSTPFGQKLGGSGSTSPYLWSGTAGYRTDGDGNSQDSTYVKVGARYYDALFGHFITRDTELDQAPYAYCDGDPVNAVDPSGHNFWKSIIGWWLLLT